jgi:hypothetical protein
MIPRRSARMTHLCSLRLTHTKNTICRRARDGPAISSTPKACGLIFQHPRRRRVTPSCLGAEASKLSSLGRQGRLEIEKSVEFVDLATGYRLSTSVGGAATGEGGDRIVCDDPHNVQEAESDAVRKPKGRCSLAGRAAPATIAGVSPGRINDRWTYTVQPSGFANSTALPRGFDV